MRILIDCKPFTLEGEFITGRRIKAVSGIPKNYGLWLKGVGDENDKAINDDEEVYVSKDKLYHFFSGPTNSVCGATKNHRNNDERGI